MSSTSSSSQSPITFTNIMGQGRVNQLGGVFINGRPLPHETRMRIIELAATGVKPCKISRDLRVSHGAVSKILNRFQETGSISPGQIGGNPRSRLTIQAVEKRIVQLKRRSPTLSAAELRATLIQHGICTKSNAPTASSINRHLRSQSMRRKIDQATRRDFESVVEEPAPMESVDEAPTTAAPAGLKSSTLDTLLCDTKSDYGGTITPSTVSQPVVRGTKRKHPLSHSIDNILNGPSTPIGSAATEIDCRADESIQEGASPSLDHRPMPNTSSSSSCSEEDGENQADSSEMVASKRSRQAPPLAEARRNRTSFTSEQLRLLEEAFAGNMYPDAAQREQLVKRSQLDEDKIITWFSNRRARNRKVFSLNLSTSLQAQRKFSPLALNRLPAHQLLPTLMGAAPPAPTPIFPLMQPFSHEHMVSNVAATAFLLLNRQLQTGCQPSGVQPKEED